MLTTLASTSRCPGLASSFQWLPFLSSSSSPSMPSTPSATLSSLPAHYLHRLFSLRGCLLLLADLNTYMPSHQDQQLKLCSMALTCVAIGNFMPSLGAFAGSHVARNVLSLSIMLPSVLISAAIQIRTGIIYAFHTEHIPMLVFLSVELLILGSTAPVLPAVKQLLQSSVNFMSKPIGYLLLFEKLETYFVLKSSRSL